jgi:Trp operon repressor
MTAARDVPQDDDRTMMQVDELDLDSIGRGLDALAKELQEAAARLFGRAMLQDGVSYSKNLHEELSDFEVMSHNGETQAAFRSTLRSMRKFRREYDRWERLTAEYALTKMRYSQRETAQELGVATSTINRWAQHPLPIEDYR